MMVDPSNTDQTSFVESLDFHDDQSSQGTARTPPADKENEKLTTQRKKKTSPLIILLILLFSLFLTIMITTVVFIPRVINPQTSFTPTPQTEQNKSNLPEALTKSIKALEDSVTLADPLTNELPFPPVNFQLHLQ